MIFHLYNSFIPFIFYQPGPLGAYRAGRKAVSVRLWRMLREHLTDIDFIRIAIEQGTPDAPPETPRGHRGQP